MSALIVPTLRVGTYLATLRTTEASSEVLGAGADFFQIGENLLLVLPGQHMRRRARFGIFGGGLHEGAAVEVRLLRPDGDEVDRGFW